jgi:hypothetical protein
MRVFIDSIFKKCPRYFSPVSPEQGMLWKSITTASSITDLEVCGALTLFRRRRQPVPQHANDLMEEQAAFLQCSR